MSRDRCAKPDPLQRVLAPLMRLATGGSSGDVLIASRSLEEGAVAALVSVHHLAPGEARPFLLSHTENGGTAATDVLVRELGALRLGRHRRVLMNKKLGVTPSGYLDRNRTNPIAEPISLPNRSSQQLCRLDCRGSREGKGAWAAG